MSREMDEDINWGKLFLKVILAFVLVILIIWVISKFILNRDSNTNVNQFEENLNQMYNVAEKYFENESKLPKNGEHSTLTLKEMIDKDLIDTLKDGKTTCSAKSSYAKVSNKDGKYTLKVLLTCGSESDYISKVIKVEEKEEIKEETKNDSIDATTNSSNQSNNGSNNNNSNSNTSVNSDNGSNNNVTVETEQVVVTDYTKMEYKFCKIDSKDYYTVIYLNSENVKNGYLTTYTIKLNDLNKVSKVDVSDDNYFLSNSYYNNYKSNLDNGFTIVDGYSAKDIANKSRNFIKASLKSNNFDYKLTNVYEKDGNYYIDVEITIKKSSKYSDTYNGTKINYVPIYFSVSYANLDDCVNDTYTNSSKYASYYVVK